MNKSLLFIPDISGFTEFVQTTEATHSQHVIAELLEILIEANTSDLQLAEVEGDALFFYKEGEVLSVERLLSQVETMFTSFYSHLKLLEKNRICPCNACANAPKLELKIIAHCGALEFITVQNNRKPFGSSVIEAHRLMKNTVDSDNYVLFSKDLTSEIQMQENYHSMLFQFQIGVDQYDGKDLPYEYAVINKEALKLKPFSTPKRVEFKRDPTIYQKWEFPIAGTVLFEYITNFQYRHHWVKGPEFLFNPKEITKLGSTHICVVNEKHLNFVTVTKNAKSGQLVYGERTMEPPGPIDALYQFYIITPLNTESCLLELEVYPENKSLFKRLFIEYIAKKQFKKNALEAVTNLYEFAINNDPSS